MEINMKKLFLVLGCLFFLISMTDAKSGKTEKYKIAYKFAENSSRTYLISSKQKLSIDAEKLKNIEYVIKVEDVVKESKKTKATLKRIYRGFKYSVQDVVIYNNIESKTVALKSYLSKIFNALKDESYQFSISNSGKVSGIKGSKDILKNVMVKIFGSTKKTEESERTYGLLADILDTSTLEAEICYVYAPLTRSSLKVGSTWKSKPKRCVFEVMNFNSPEVYTVEDIKVENKNALLNIKVRGSVEPKETKDYKVDSNKTKGNFKFNHTTGEIQELKLRTKAKYTFYKENSGDDEKEVDCVNETDQTVLVKLVSSSTTGNPKVKIVTSMGDIVVELFEDDTPNTVANFIELCEAKFYDDIRFHRIIKGFMIQGGCPFAKGSVSARAGSGDAGYKFADEFVDKYKFDSKGLLAMANSGPNTNGSQFFITLGAAEWLNGKHTIFGKVIEGMDIVDKLGAVQTSKPGDKPVKEVYIKETQILQKRNHEYKVKKD